MEQFTVQDGGRVRWGEAMRCLKTEAALLCNSAEDCGGQPEMGRHAEGHCGDHNARAGMLQS